MNNKIEVTIDVEKLYHGNAKLEDIELYIKQVRLLAGEGNIIKLTGRGPIWLYLTIAHALHGKARSLYYNSPVTGDVLIFDHNPFKTQD